MKENKPTVWLLWLDNMRNLSSVFFVTYRKEGLVLTSEQEGWWDEKMRSRQRETSDRQTRSRHTDIRETEEEGRSDRRRGGKWIKVAIVLSGNLWVDHYEALPLRITIYLILQNIIDLTEWKCTTMHQGDSQHRQQIRTGTFSFKFILCPWTSWHTVTGDLLRFTCCGLASGKSMLPVTLQGGGWIYVPQ